MVRLGSGVGGPVYEDIGKDYNANRRADSRVVQHLLDLLQLPSGSRIADIGAGTGNYTTALAESDYRLVAVEPAQRMVVQANSNPAIQWLIGVGESVPLMDSGVDGVVSTMTFQHFRPKIGAVAKEIRRILSDGPAVLLVVDPREAVPFWFADYFPQIRARMFDSYAPLAEIEAHFKAAGFHAFDVIPFPLPADFTDLNMHSGWNRPEIYLDATNRQNMSPFAMASADEVDSGVEKLRRDLESGAWDATNGHLRQADTLDLGFRFLRAS